MAPTRSVADIISHYLSDHRRDRSQDQIARMLGCSDTSLSAWKHGHRVPKLKRVVELRQIVGCQCLEFGDEAIRYVYGKAATTPVAASQGRPRSNQPSVVGIPIRTPPAMPAVRPPSRQLIVGRAGEVRAFAELQAGRTTHQVTNIFGPGGIGKTEVFHKFVAFAQRNRQVVGYADVAQIRYGGQPQPYTAAEILRALAATIDRPEFEAFRRDLWDFDLARNAVRVCGGVDRLFAPNGRPLDEARLPQTAEGASRALREAMRSRFAFDRYLRQVHTALTRTFCEGLHALPDGEGAATLLLDTYEEIGGLDDWICRQVVPMLPDQTRLVILSRGQLTKVNIDWLDHQDSLDFHPLPELSDDEAKSYLRYYGLTDARAQQAVYAVTGGYPLLLVLARALAMESGGWEAIGELEHDRDRDAIARGLLDRILREERVKSVRDVLETCSIAPWIDPGIIAALLEMPAGDAHALYTELARHSFVTRHPRGVALHDKLRELLQVRVKFASEARYEELRTKLATYLASKGGGPNA
ncbi:helix-turn-helix domain-containing protein [Planosporangium mesophilum]|uniref:helix-turn-helix domain-containing protein n=1 Tax=Planosporangium mesophilum TaxID=689768 RepID=UPI0014390E83|nr:helix-turn-helix transcriptional regulator [Planosporangium mesophilum]NJC83635.1 hypothetical protein [Planosporangium mesophilum]